MKPISFNLWLVGEVMMLIVIVTSFWFSFMNGAMTFEHVSVVAGILAIICAVESEQRNDE